MSWATYARGSQQWTANVQLDGPLGPLNSWHKAAQSSSFIIPLSLRVHRDVLSFLPDFSPLGHLMYRSWGSRSSNILGNCLPLLHSRTTILYDLYYHLLWGEDLSWNLSLSASLVHPCVSPWDRVSLCRPGLELKMLMIKAGTGLQFLFWDSVLFCGPGSPRAV